MDQRSAAMALVERASNGASLDAWCLHPEGWGPLSGSRLDWTPCFEEAGLVALPAILAILTFILRIAYFKTSEQPHGLGRTESIYRSTQAAMIAISLAVAVRAGQLLPWISSSSDLPPLPLAFWSSVLLCISWITAVVLNTFEHDYSVRSSDFIFVHYVISLGVAGIQTRTLLELDPGMDHGDPFFRYDYPTMAIYILLLLIGLTCEAWPRGSTAVQKAAVYLTTYEKANCFSRLTFHFYQPIISLGYKRPLEPTDVVGQLEARARAANGSKALTKIWQENLKRSGLTGKQASFVVGPDGERTRINVRPRQSLFVTILKSLWKPLIPITILRVSLSLLLFTQPALMGELLKFIKSYDTKDPNHPIPEPASKGVILALALFVTTMLLSIMQSVNKNNMMALSVEARSSLIAMIYGKALRLSPGARQQSTAGAITNHMSVDADVWSDGIIQLAVWVSTPIEIILGHYMLYNLIGWCMLSGVAVMLMLTPLQIWRIRVFGNMLDEKLKFMDTRIRILTEVIANMKIVKLYSWGDAFRDKILKVRDKELKVLKDMGLVYAVMSLLFTSSSVLMSMLAFALFSWKGGPGGTPGVITPEIAFVSILLFAMIRDPLSRMSEAVGSLVAMEIGTRRIEEFLLQEEIDEDVMDRSLNLPRDPEQPVIQIKGASFSWDSSITITSDDTEQEIRGEEQPLLSGEAATRSISKPALTDINLKIKSRSLTAIVGRVGQGKSSLLNAIIGEMYLLTGSASVHGKIAYVPQQAWIMNASLKDNILFGKPYVAELYEKVIFVAGLEPDIEMLPAGDMTEIGERGINLSGGQKQRVSLARAAYQDADIYLLDDPLSAVDGHVDQHLWQHLLGPQGMLGQKTRLLATHGIHHLHEADQIVVVKQGTINESGNYADLMAAKESFYRLIVDYSAKHREEQRERPRRNSSGVGKLMRRKSSQHAIPSAVVADDQVATKITNNTLMTTGAPSLSSSTAVSTSLELEEDSDANTVNSSEVTTEAAPAFVTNNLTGVEAVRVGAVGWPMYHEYFKAASYTQILGIVVFQVLSQVCVVGISLWLKYWIRKTTDGEDLSMSTFLGVYGLLTAIVAFANVCLVYMTFSMARIRASAELHRNLLVQILKLPMSFFDTTPLGRIVNRFSSDMYVIDERLPWKMVDFFFFAVCVSSTLIIIAITTPLFLLAVPFLVSLYLLIQGYYMTSSRALKRVHSVSKSPLYQHFNETLGGLSTIRAMAVQQDFIAANMAKTDFVGNGFVAFMYANRWLEIRLAGLSSLVVLAAAMFAIFNRETVDASIVGLTLSFALQLTAETTYMVKTHTDQQNNLISVERVIEYANKNPEAPERIPDLVLPPGWPNSGTVEFQNYSTRYRQGLGLVIKHVSFAVKSGEKVGIVGRTGAGKSSLTLALFRIVEAANSHWAKASDNSTEADSDSKKAVMTLGGANGVSTISAVDATSSSRSESDDDEEHMDGGRILIDGVDISTLGLDTLRQQLAIIPQDPTLFAGTLRENLDPFNEEQDVDLWRALERAHLKEHVAGLPGQLMFEISQGGDNMSVGQRSLIALARALLRKTKILVLDEATSSVDVQTDELIQKTIRTEFKDRTILTIAHRLKTVMDSDKILVMEKGRVEEYDSPSNLLVRQDSLFYSLAKQVGLAF